jgi:hypothetical protein
MANQDQAAAVCAETACAEAEAAAIWTETDRTSVEAAPKCVWPAYGEVASFGIWR